MNTEKNDKSRISLEIDEALDARLRERVNAAPATEKLSLNSLCGQLLFDALTRLEKNEKRAQGKTRQTNRASKEELDAVNEQYQSVSDYKSAEQFTCQMMHMTLSLITKIFDSLNLPADEKAQYLEMAKKVSKYQADTFS